MNSIPLAIVASRTTTRDGNHPDDVAYLDQLIESIADVLSHYQFRGVIHSNLGIYNRRLEFKVMQPGDEDDDS